MATINEYDKGYLNGFYNALQGVKYLATDPNLTVAELNAAADDVIQEMRENGELEHVNTKVAEALTSVLAIEDAIRELDKKEPEVQDTDPTQEFLDALTKIFGGK